MVNFSQVRNGKLGSKAESKWMFSTLPPPPPRGPDCQPYPQTNEVVQRVVPAAAEGSDEAAAGGRQCDRSGPPWPALPIFDPWMVNAQLSGHGVWVELWRVLDDVRRRWKQQQEREEMERYMQSQVCMLHVWAIHRCANVTPEKLAPVYFLVGPQGVLNLIGLHIRGKPNFFWCFWVLLIFSVILISLFLTILLLITISFLIRFLCRESSRRVASCGAFVPRRSGCGTSSWTRDCARRRRRRPGRRRRCGWSTPGSPWSGSGRTCWQRCRRRTAARLLSPPLGGGCLNQTPPNALGESREPWVVVIHFSPTGWNAPTPSLACRE